MIKNFDSQYMEKDVEMFMKKNQISVVDPSILPKKSMQQHTLNNLKALQRKENHRILGQIMT